MIVQESLKSKKSPKNKARSETSSVTYIHKHSVLIQDMLLLMQRKWHCHSGIVSNIDHHTFMNLYQKSMENKYVPLHLRPQQDYATNFYQ